MIIRLLLGLLLFASPALAGYGMRMVSGAGLAQSSGTIPSGWTLQVSDDFNRSNADLTTPWVSPASVDTPKIVSNVVNAENSGTFSYAKHSGAPTNLTQMACVKISSSGTMGPSVRESTSTDNTKYDLLTDMSNGNFWFRRIVTGSATALTTDVITVSVGDILCITATGTNPVVLESFINGVSKTTYSDSSGSRITEAGYPGVFIRSGALDDFSGYDK